MSSSLENISRCSSAFLCATVLICLFHKIDGEVDIETLTDEIFNPCKCVPYNLCYNRTIITNGSVDTTRNNGTSTTCPNNLEVCCNNNDRLDLAYLTTEATTSSNEKSITENLEEIVFDTNNTTSGNNSSSCTCVPYYLCISNTYDDGGIKDLAGRDDAVCKSYLEICCKTNETIELPKTSTPRPKKLGCGNRNPEGLGSTIEVYDSETQFGEFPWMVAILRRSIRNGTNINVYHCGGALIHPQVVLTAAHCTNQADESFLHLLKVRVGEWDSQTYDEIYPHQDRNVSSIVVHPQYNKARLYNDIALLFLETPVTIEENVNVICLPAQNEVVESSKCFATGWGKDIFGKEGSYSMIQKRVQLPMMPRSDCQENLRKKTKLGRYFELHESFVCAGGKSGMDTCKGDGGSPLVCPIRGHENEERYSQVGIVAWGSGCGEADVPGIYVNVALFRNWIDEQMTLKNIDLHSYQVVESQ